MTHKWKKGYDQFGQQVLTCKNCPAYQEIIASEQPGGAGDTIATLWFDSEGGSYHVKDEETCDDVNRAYEVTKATEMWLCE